MTLYPLVIGKIIYGISAGIMLTACALYLSETLPDEKVGSHGFAVNFGVTLGITLVLSLGILVPTDTISSSYLVVAVVGPAVAVLDLLAWLLVFKTEPIAFCVDHGDAVGDYQK